MQPKWDKTNAHISLNEVFRSVNSTFNLFLKISNSKANPETAQMLA